MSDPVGDVVEDEAAVPSTLDEEEPVYVETVAVYSAPDAVTAEIVRGALEGEGIPAMIGEQVADAYAGPLSVGEGYYCEIRVPAEYADTARAILQAYEEGQGSLPDEGEDTSATATA